MQSPIISVIVVTYNQEETIGRTLDSILSQQCHVPFEIVIGEDCSNDNTRLICEQYKDKYPEIIKLMPQCPNKGVIDNYFDCFLECKGKYIADCAGDDFWVDNQKLEKELIILENNNDVTLVHTAWQYFNAKKGKTTVNDKQRFRDAITDGHKMLEAIVTQTSSPVIHLCTALYRAYVLRKEYNRDNFMFRNKDFGCEDLQICFIMALNGKIAYIDDITLSYSVGCETVSYNKDESKQFLFVKNVSNLSFYLCNKYNLRSSNITEYFNQRIFALSMHAFRSHDKRLCLNVKDLAKTWGLPINRKSMFIHHIMDNSFLWYIALICRNILVATKHLICLLRP